MTCLDALSRIAQILTGIAALFISSLALIFAIRESRRKADHDKLAMRPYLVGRSDRQLVSGTQPQVIRFGFNLKNAGLGPARILDMTYSLDGIIQKITEPNDLGDIIMRCLGANAPHDVKSQFVQSKFILGAKEELELISFELPKDVARLPVVTERLRAVRLEVKYESLYNDPERYDSDEKSGSSGW
jgi:hypothetical protein